MGDSRMGWSQRCGEGSEAQKWGKAVHLFIFYKQLAWYLGLPNIHCVKMAKTKCSISKRGLQEEEVKQ